MSFWGISARNPGQVAAAKALMNDKPFLFLTGPAGTGKTLITQAVGMHRTLEQKDFRKIIYTRLQIQLGEETGFLPGDINEKTFPFVSPFMDNLEVMSERAKEILDYLATGRKQQKVFFEPIQTVRGRSIPHAFFMCDEVQNLDISTICAIGTRPAEGSKFIFMGNFAQTDNPKLRTPENNGLYKLLDGLYREKAFKYFDHVNLTEVERHPVVELVEKILRNHELDPRFEELEQRGNVN